VKLLGAGLARKRWGSSIVSWWWWWCGYGELLGFGVMAHPRLDTLTGEKLCALVECSLV
jgi:hypothetical protein